MKCEYCGGTVLWDWPIKPDGDNLTTCQKCGAKDSQEYEPDIFERYE